MAYAIALTLAMLTCGLIGELLIRARVQRHGGLLFWRIGRLGGSFYLARKEG